MGAETLLEKSTDGDGQESYLRIDNLWKAFGDFIALKNISLSISDGEFVCFLGPSGCGKTTLLRAIAGLDLQTSGRIEQAGRDISNLPPAERDFGIFFQSYALFPNLTIEKNISLGLENAGLSKSVISARVKELLELVGLPDQGKKYPAQLSGGQQQRIALARAIAMSPGLLLLDEPLSALDAKVRVHLRHEVKELQRKLGINQVEATAAEKTAEGKSTVRIGSKVFTCGDHDFPVGTDVIAAVRPEDVVPHGAYFHDKIAETENAIACRVNEMEFLGSFWRTRLSSETLGDTEIFADFSINAIRRLEIAEDTDIAIEIPGNRLKVFAAKAGDH